MSSKEYCEKCICTNVAIVYNGIPFCLNCLETVKLSELFKDHKAINIFGNYEPPTKILDNLYISNLKSVEKYELFKLGINNIVICGRGLKNSNHYGFNNLHLQIADSINQEIIPYIEIVNEFIDLHQTTKTLIHCQSGMSRSGSIVIGYLMHKFDYDYETAFNFVKEKYPRVWPNASFKEQLEKWKQS